MMAPSQDMEASWCQTCCGGTSCTGTSLAFGHAFDVMLVRRASSAIDVPAVAASCLYFNFPFRKRGDQVFLEVWDGSEWLRFPIQNETRIQRQRNDNDEEEHDLVLNSNDKNVTNGYRKNHNGTSSNSPTHNMKMERWSDEPEPEQEITKLLSNDGNDGEHDPVALHQLAKALSMGKNAARFVLVHKHVMIALAPCFVHLWSTQDRVVVMDIDGSITKSNVMGIIDTLVTEAYSHCHAGVCQFLTQFINETPRLSNGGQLRILYLSSRPLVLANFTRKFLTQVMQPQSTARHLSISLPDGPLLGFGGSLGETLHMELITHSVHVFKQKALEDNVVAPWARLGQQDTLPFWAGLGNTWMDVQAYRAAGIPLARMGFITKQSVIHVLRPPLPSLSSLSRHSIFPAPTVELNAEISFDTFLDPRLLEYFRQDGYI